ncbi:HlyD family secretion protein [Pseudomonas japonica]|uniref:HlyD family secretion protein n=1 Tax=Pseudomonas japonica TaxID=256466 RepID=UPI0015E2E962|nr:HlyD family efflux transporter periplasmic adaptor subunit [Pseudomonas japonica]MBA1289772.1 HlyD family efflux transporter periplasmic adaptor subunit [Pseudomonas japonica]
MATANPQANGEKADNAQPQGNPRKRKLMLFLLLLVVVIAGIAVFAWHELHGRFYEETDDAYVNGNVVEVTPLIAGTVVSIGADDGDLVQEGQTLISFDPADARIALENAQANLARTVRQVRGMYSNVDSQRSQANARRVELQKAQENFNRRKTLAASGAISQEELSHARDDLAAAQAALGTAQQQLAGTVALVDDTVISSHPDVQAAAAQLRDAYLARARTTLVAPVTGYVAKRTVQLGQRVQPGTPTMAVIPLDQVWVDANFKETQLHDMRIGQPVTLETDLYGDDVTYGGTVQSIGAGTGSAFSLLPAQNATGNWIKIVQRVPVRIKLDPQPLKDHPLRIGLSTVATVDLHDQTGAVLTQQSTQQATFSTRVYEQQLDEADSMIARLIHDNSAPGKTAQR